MQSGADSHLPEAGVRLHWGLLSAERAVRGAQSPDWERPGGMGRDRQMPGQEEGGWAEGRGARQVSPHQSAGHILPGVDVHTHTHHAQVCTQGCRCTLHTHVLVHASMEYVSHAHARASWARLHGWTRVSTPKQASLDAGQYEAAIQAHISTHADAPVHTRPHTSGGELHSGVRETAV